MVQGLLIIGTVIVLIYGAIKIYCLGFKHADMLWGFLVDLENEKRKQQKLSFLEIQALNKKYRRSHN